MIQTATAAPGPLKVYCLGDSLTIGHGVSPEESWPSLLQARFDLDNPKQVQFINGGISGSTSASAASRLRFALGAKPDWVILALGANDGLRGLDLAALRQNLAAAIDLAQANQVKVILLGMKMPPNYGRAYALGFEQVYVALAKEKSLPWVPFFLAPVAGRPELNQADGIHPNAQGYQRIAEALYPSIKNWLLP